MCVLFLCAAYFKDNSGTGPPKKKKRCKKKNHKEKEKSTDVKKFTPQPKQTPSPATQKGSATAKPKGSKVDGINRTTGLVPKGRETK